MRYAFDDFEMDVRLFEVRHRGVKLQAPPRVFDLLLVLVRNSDRVVTKSELFTALWPECRVSEDALVQTIRRARRLLGVSVQASIETVRGRGYRFVRPVRCIAQATSSHSPSVEGGALRGLVPERDHVHPLSERALPIWTQPVSK